ncbi:glycosyltransferase [Fundidesulfovibrio agrisoli]|uniref:glycosyltransferase n=1 Tax=Fundidesulfovibrio agrisoli TaxID=2922717 RepID=UPI001FADF192|nr:glycosyltransferase [Fundidesulfovibrio agrisoli]
MKSDPFFSVIMPTFNQADSINRAIRSVLSQTFDSYELIVIDDGSSDNTIEVLAEIDDDRFIIKKIEHSGVSAARNVGIKNSKGKYIAFLDADNEWKCNFLEKFHDAIQNNFSKFRVFYCNGYLYDKDSLRGTIPPLYSEALMFHQPLLDLNGFVIESSLIQLAGNFDENLFRWVDYEMMLRASEFTSFFFINEHLYIYYRGAGGITHSEDRIRPWAPTKLAVSKFRSRNLRVGYVLWDFPASSQMFVHNELSWLVCSGFDVVVYYREEANPAANLDFEVPHYKIDSYEHLSSLAKIHRRNLLHAHFGYPQTTKLGWPAAENALIPFTTMPHGIDVFSKGNRNRVELLAISKSTFCKRIFAIGSYHENFYINNGVSKSKITRVGCSVPTSWFDDSPDFFKPLSPIVLVSRFVEKKGVFDFIEIAQRCQDLNLQFELYGYGVLEEEVASRAGSVPNLALYCGKISHNEVYATLNRAGGVLLPCKEANDGDLDGLPVILLEGAARGCTLFSSNVSSIPDLLNDNTGYLVQPCDINGFELAIRTASQVRQDVIESMRRHAFDYVKSEHCLDTVMRRIVDVWVNDFLQLYP